LTTSDPAGLLAFYSADATRLSQYRFGLRTADFLICRECGVYLGVTMQTDEGRFGVLNVLALRSLLTDLPAAATVDYDADTRETRRTRRRAGWTPLAADSA
jgi:hypothetical protein